MNGITDVLHEKSLTQTWLSRKWEHADTVVNACVQHTGQAGLEALFAIGEMVKTEARDLTSGKVIKTKQ